MNPIEILFLLPTGKKRTRHFRTEGEVVEYLAITHAEAAPLCFSYADGTPLRSSTIDRIYSGVFESLPALQV